MDALAMREGNNALPYRSTVNAAHMCGHDGHMTCLLAFSAVLVMNLDSIPEDKTIRLLFQPAEEVGQGAISMIQAGCLEGVDAIYGLHNRPTLPLGKLYCPDGAIMAAKNDFIIEISGKGGHGAYPHRNSDVILAASHIVTSLHNIIPLEINSQEEAVLTVCIFQSGISFDVMPSNAVLKGSFRTFNPEIQQYISSRILEISTLTAQRHKCEAKVQDEETSKALINHASNALFVRKAGVRALGAENVVEWKPVPGSEDFSYYLDEKPGSFFFIGSEVDQNLHSSSFNFNDKMIPFGIKMWVGLIEELFDIDLDKSLINTC
jgi:hippurate hydrolase